MPAPVSLFPPHACVCVIDRTNTESSNMWRTTAHDGPRNNQREEAVCALRFIFSSMIFFLLSFLIIFFLSVVLYGPPSACACVMILNVFVCLSYFSCSLYIVQSQHISDAYGTTPCYFIHFFHSFLHSSNRLIESA